VSVETMSLLIATLGNTCPHLQDRTLYSHFQKRNFCRLIGVQIRLGGRSNRNVTQLSSKGSFCLRPDMHVFDSEVCGHVMEWVACNSTLKLREKATSSYVLTGGPGHVSS
jgi:hypothetical protein